MIIFYSVPSGGDPENPDERTEWGRTIDGAVIEDHGAEGAPDDYPYESFSDWVRAQEEDFLEGFGDPMAVLKRFNVARVVAGIPARGDADTDEDVFFDGDYAYAERFGDLSEREHAEFQKWENWDVATVNPGAYDVYKHYDYPERFNVVAVEETFSDRRGVLQGYWDTDAEEILGDVGGRFDAVIENLRDRTRLNDAVAMIRDLRGHDYNAVVIDSVTGLPINDPRIIAGDKRPPDPERDDINRAIAADFTVEDESEIPDFLRDDDDTDQSNTGTSNPYETGSE